MPSALAMLELAGLIGIICALHAQRARVGLGPLLAVAGLLEGMLFFASKVPGVHATLLFGDVVSFSYTLVLPAFLAIIFVVYVLDGTVTARRVILAIVCLYVIHAAIDVAWAYHANNPPDGVAPIENHPLGSFSWRERIASLLAVLADFVTLTVVYQFLVNRARWMPVWVAGYIAFVAAMLTDAVVFGLVFSGVVNWDLRLVDKVQSGLAGALPASLYVWWQMGGRREPVQRGTFDLIAMQRQVKDAIARLETVRETFSRYVPPDVVDDIMANPGEVRLGGESKVVSVLFCDIRGYSTLAERLDPTEVIGLLNRYLEAVSKPILDHRGMINEIEGDGILAVFGAPLELRDHAALATQSAVAMHRAVEDFNRVCELDGTAEIWRAAGMDRLRVRIGIHSGDVVAGNIGTARRVKYAVIGDTVNTAARVENLCKKLRTPLLISEATVDALDDARDLFRLRDRGKHDVKGRREPVHVWEVETGLGALPTTSPLETAP